MMTNPRSTEFVTITSPDFGGGENQYTNLNNYGQVDEVNLPELFFTNGKS